MCESNTTIEDYAEELATVYGISYHATLTALWSAIGCGYGLSEPIEVSIEEYEWLQEMLVDE